VDTTLDLLTIALLPGVQSRTVGALRERGALADVLAHPDEHVDLLLESARGRLRSGEARRAAEAELGLASRAGIAIVGRDDIAYPRLLAEIFDPPAVLYVKGRLLADEGGSSVAIVGSRAATAAGTSLARTMAEELAQAGLTVVSGFARGVDTAAHSGALDAGGRTVAVLGSGLRQIYPPENTPWVERVAERGAVVSEFPLQLGPRPAHFPRRNRIIAGWGRGVVVVEAGVKSGALITASLALESGREVMAVPGHPTHTGAMGTNSLIRDGARLVRHASDVALELGLELRPAPARADAAAADSSLLASLQVDRPATLEELVERSGRSVSELLAELTELELLAQVRRLPGPQFLRNGRKSGELG
jgi:DNA processing protein